MNKSLVTQEGGSGEHKEGRKEIQLACFRIGAESYALDIMRIKEIIRPQKLTPVPKAPSFIEGVINLRGSVIPVVDLCKRFEHGAGGLQGKARIIICTLSGRIAGLLVDEVFEVRRYSRKEVQPAPHFLKGKGSEFFLGVCRRGEDLVMILDLERILSTDEKIDLDMIRQSAGSVSGA
ncbi:chemotaxis protein CheW [Desulfuromonas versatilis]|uniref:Chemotaxis protein CheW n=1 Tax=Desulfuromonas versatilis TaxID=2802975 RepID=A0ABN6DZ24_9BACT|nr:chemotaxis protein CheW [Desulfuromonas versatilis]BCR05122.1 chemotaxis protein CheW [Desulfuromonas versatilis]